MALGIGIHVSAPTGSLNGAITTATKTTTSGSTVLLFAAVAGSAWNATPVQDNKSNTWTQVGSELPFDASNTLTRVYKATNITGGAGHTFTVNAPTGYPALLVVEITGADVSPTVTSQRVEDTSSPYASPSISPSNACILAGGLWTNSPSGTETDTWGGSFASGDKLEELSDANTGVTGSMAAVAKAAGTYNSSVTVSGTTVTATAAWIVTVENASTAHIKRPPVQMTGGFSDLTGGIA